MAAKQQHSNANLGESLVRKLKDSFAVNSNVAVSEATRIFGEKFVKRMSRNLTRMNVGNAFNVSLQQCVR